MTQTMSNSALATVTILSPNRSPRTHVIDTITIHHTATVGVSARAIGSTFASSARRASSNYGIGVDGEIGLYVPEDHRAWTSSNSANDNRAITIEVANESGAPDWKVSKAAYLALILLCTDICKRNGIKKLLWKKDPTLIGQVDKQNMTVHRWFSPTLCPGPYLYESMGVIAQQVNKRLGDEEGEDVKRYNMLSEMPEYARPTIRKLCAAGILGGKTALKDENGYPASLDLSEDMVRMLVIHDRLGLYNK